MQKGNQPMDRWLIRSLADSSTFQFDLRTDVHNRKHQGITTNTCTLEAKWGKQSSFRCLSSVYDLSFRPSIFSFPMYLRLRRDFGKGCSLHYHANFTWLGDTGSVFGHRLARTIWDNSSAPLKLLAVRSVERLLVNTA